VERIALEREVTLRGLRFHYREWPRDPAPTLVLLHGVTSQSGAWQDLAERLAAFRVLALDQRGHGLSDRADDYSLDALVDDLVAFVERLDVRRFALGGHSLGARVAYLYAAREDARVERLILSDVGPDRVAPPRLPPRLDFADPDDALAVVRAFRSDQPEPLARRLLSENLVRRDDGRWTFRFDPSVVTNRAPFDPEAHWRALGRIRCPTLILRGERSAVLSRESAQRMGQVIPRAAVVEVADADHGLWYQQPESFGAAIVRFLSPAA
jgi:pimeloyl-ACP methyl ester carboxylesterase